VRLTANEVFPKGNRRFKSSRLRKYQFTERMVMTQPGDVMLSEIHETPKVLSRILSEFGANEVAQKLLDTQSFHSVIILARGTSDNAAHFLKYLIEIKLGLPVGLASPSAATMYSTNLNYANTLVVALSQSGQSSDLLAFAKAAKAGKGYLLSITNDANSPLALLSDLHIPINAGPEIAVPATKSYIGQLFISYLLVMSWSKSPMKTDRLMKSVEKWCSSSDAVNGFAQELDISKPIYILGRGFSYPNAKEFALKLQETSLIPVQGMSSSDFLHGPIASLHEDSQVVFIAPQGTPKESFGEAPDRVRAITGKAFWIGSTAQSKAEDVVLQGESAESEIESAIADAVAFQLVTHKIAVLNNLNPDSPRGLSKVTITR
jgi:glucosamine--fructose-6-phosphate aminotransferase (isomerizing)